MDPFNSYHDVRFIDWHQKGNKFLSVHDKFAGEIGCDWILIWDIDLFAITTKT